MACTYLHILICIFQYLLWLKLCHKTCSLPHYSAGIGLHCGTQAQNLQASAAVTQIWTCPLVKNRVKDDSSNHLTFFPLLICPLAAIFLPLSAHFLCNFGLFIASPSSYIPRWGSWYKVLNEIVCSSFIEQLKWTDLEVFICSALHLKAM